MEQFKKRLLKLENESENLWWKVFSLLMELAKEDRKANTERPTMLKVFEYDNSYKEFQLVGVRNGRALVKDVEETEYEVDFLSFSLEKLLIIAEKILTYESNI